ncbi:MAG: hypothetical protein KGZ97_09660 [Bacteroidetes bacterium]|nr:hypothetical protein [Bacteroidota bacterium]
MTTKNTQIIMKRGLEAGLPTLSVGEFGFTTDSHRLFIGSPAGNIEITNQTPDLSAYMLKSIYDNDPPGSSGEGLVDQAESVEWLGVMHVPSQVLNLTQTVIDESHAHSNKSVLDDVTQTHLDNSHDPKILGTKEIDESNIGNRKAVFYFTSDGKIRYDDIFGSKINEENHIKTVEFDWEGVIAIGETGTISTNNAPYSKTIDRVLLISDNAPSGTDLKVAIFVGGQNVISNGLGYITVPQGLFSGSFLEEIEWGSNTSITYEIIDCDPVTPGGGFLNILVESYWKYDVEDLHIHYNLDVLNQINQDNVHAHYNLDALNQINESHIHYPNVLGTKVLDETGIADGDVIKYDLALDKWVVAADNAASLSGTFSLDCGLFTETPSFEIDCGTF